MKRGRSNPRNGTMAPATTAKSAKKKAKGAEGKEKEVAEEWKVVATEGFSAAEMEEWRVELWSGVDEEMSWATWWCPFWEMEAVEDAYDALFGDVMWDFDIWDLKESGRNALNI